MNKAAAARDITAHFVRDFNDGVLTLEMSLDDAIYAACVTEYGYGELSEDPEVRREVLGAIDGRFSRKAPFVYASIRKHTPDEKALRSIFAALEKKAELEVFQYDIILSILSDQIAPLIMSSGNIMTLFAYHAVRRLIEDMRNQKSQAQELESPTSQEEPTSYQILDAPTYSSKRVDVEATLTNDQLQEVGESLSERAHEKWVEREKAKGNAGDPNMVPYEELPEADKESDRDYAHEFMELLEENGFDIVPQEQ